MITPSQGVKIHLLVKQQRDVTKNRLAIIASQLKSMQKSKERSMVTSCIQRIGKILTKGKLKVQLMMGLKQVRVSAVMLPSRRQIATVGAKVQIRKTVAL